MAEVPISPEGQERLSLIRKFNDLHYKILVDDPQTNDEQRTIYTEQAEQLLGCFSPEERKSFLWDCVRQVIIDVSSDLVTQLELKETKAFFQMETLPPGEKIDIDYWAALIRSAIKKYCPVAIETSPWDPRPAQFYTEQSFFKELDSAERPDLIRVCANLGHDLMHIPSLSPYVYGLYDESSKNKLEDPQFGPKYQQAKDNMPELWQATRNMFRAFGLMAEGKFPQESGVSITDILEGISVEAATRANIYFSEIRFRKKNYLSTDPTVFIKGSVAINTHIAPDLKIKGNEPMLDLLFYQLTKNAIVLFKEKGIKDGILQIDADEVEVNGQKMIAIRVADNGVGIDLDGILRAKQKLLGKQDRKLTPREKQIAGSWASLDLRVIDIVNYIFERRVSGAERKSQHSGIGLALVKEIIDACGGVIWATNNSGAEKFMGGRGAKFLIILDPTDGSLKTNLPVLFEVDKAPAQLLEEIENQLVKLSTNN